MAVETMCTSSLYCVSTSHNCCYTQAKRLDIAPEKALQLFYESQTCADLHDKSTGLYLYGDLYVADEFMREKGEDG